jgi:hypothetical protein
MALAHVITCSIDDVKQFVVDQAGLLTLQAWLAESTEKKDSKHTIAVLKVLDSLPVTLASLQAPCQLGKMVGKLRKATDLGDGVLSLSQSLVAKWKSIVQNSTFKPDKVNSSLKQDSSTSSSGSGVQPHKHIGANKNTASLQPSKEEDVKEESRVLGDGDIFSAAERSRERVSLRSKEQQQKLAAVDRVEKQTPLTRVSASPFDSRPSTTAISSIGNGGNSVSSLATGSYLQTIYQDHTLGPRERARLRAKEAAARVPSPPRVPDSERKVKKKKVSWPEDDKLVAVRMFYRDDEPLAATAKGPSPQDPTGDVTGEKVEVEKVNERGREGRRKEGEDKKFSRKRGREKEVDEPRIEATSRPDRQDRPVFASAAKMEHLSEAEALRIHKMQEDKEREDLRRRIDSLAPEIEWYPPPDVAMVSCFAALEVAQGEESIQVKEGAIRRSKEPPAYYTNPKSIPPTPADPPVGPDRGIIQPIHLLPRIPLTKEEASVWSASTAATSTAPMVAPSQHTPMHAVRPMQPQQQPLASYKQTPSHFANSSTTAVLPTGLTETIAQLAASGVLPPVPTSVPNSGRIEAPQPMHPSPSSSLPLQRSLKPMLGLHRPTGVGENNTSSLPSRSQAPCKFYNTPLGCRLGNSCRFAHVDRPVGEGGRQNYSFTDRDGRNGKALKSRRTY